MSFFGSLVSSLKMALPKMPQVMPVRFRYHAERRAKPLLRRYGYVDRFATNGLLPRGEYKLNTMPAYKYIYFH